MQPILEKILHHTLTDKEKKNAFFMTDDDHSYYVYAWILNDEIIKIGHGKEDTYRKQKPVIYSTMAEQHLYHIFAYEHLTEIEAYVLSIYENHKFQKFGYKSIDDFGLWTEEI